MSCSFVAHKFPESVSISGPRAALLRSQRHPRGVQPGSICALEMRIRDNWKNVLTCRAVTSTSLLSDAASPSNPHASTVIAAGPNKWRPRLRLATFIICAKIAARSGTTDPPRCIYIINEGRNFIKLVHCLESGQFRRDDVNSPPVLWHLSRIGLIKIIKRSGEDRTKFAPAFMLRYVRFEAVKINFVL